MLNTYSLHTQYLDLKNKAKELKRLQKEIDEAEERINEATQSLWGTDLNEDSIHLEMLELIEENQSKIKQIIEEL